MNKKWIGLLIILFVFFLAIGSVSAANFVDRDFDGYFSMKAPGGVNFQKKINDTTEHGMHNVLVGYTNDHIEILYIDSVLFSENSSAFYYQDLFESLNPDSTKCYEYLDGNLTILEPISKNDLSFSLVGKSSGNKILIIVGDDLDTIKEMGRSAKFK